MFCNNDENMVVYISSFCYKLDLVKSKHEHDNDCGNCKNLLQREIGIHMTRLQISELSFLQPHIHIDKYESSDFNSQLIDGLRI